MAQLTPKLTHRPFRETSIIAFLGLAVVAISFSCVLLIASRGQNHLESTRILSIFFSSKIERVNCDSYQSQLMPNFLSIYCQVSKHPSTAEVFSFSHAASSCPRSADHGSQLNGITKRVLHKRWNGARECLTLDTTFESIGNLVRKSTQDRKKRLAQFQTPHSTNPQEGIDKNAFRGAVPRKPQQFRITGAGKEPGPSNYATKKNPNLTLQGGKDSRDEVGHALKSHDWKPLEGHIDQIKWNAYRSHLSDTKALILHEDNRKGWQDREKHLADEKDTRAFFDLMRPDFKLGASFKLYNFLIGRSLSDQELWWSKADFKELQKICDFDYDDINLTIQVGDLIQPYLYGKKTVLSSEEKTQVRNKFFELFTSFKQSGKSYDKKWSTGPGKQWLNECFSGASDTEFRYRRFVTYLGSESHPHEWKESLDNLSQILQAKDWAPSSLKFVWLDHGFDVDEMEELLCILEAYKTRNVKPAYRKATQASQLAKSRNPPLLPLAYSAENMLNRLVKLHRSLSNQAKKRRRMLKWIAENLYDHDEIYESILNIGKYTANTSSERFRFDILLAAHRLFHKIQTSTHLVFAWIHDLFGPKRMGSIWRYFTFKK